MKNAKKSKDAEKGMIRQQINMAPEERLALAQKIKQEYYGKRLPDVRDF